MQQLKGDAVPTRPAGAGESGPPQKPAPVTRSGRLVAGTLVNVAMTVLIGYLVLVPLVILLYSSFKASTTQLPFQVPGFSVTNYLNVFESSHFASVAWNTVLYVVGSLLVALVLSMSLAYLMERTDLPCRRFLAPMALAPMAVPVTVMAIAWALVANPVNGPLAVAVRNVLGLHIDIYSLPGMILVMGIFGVPSMYLTIAPAFARLNPELEEAAAALGVPLRRRLRLIVLPLVAPAVSAAGMLLVVVALEGFAIPAILGLPKQIFVFSSQIQYYVQPPTGVPNFGQASTYGVLLLAVSLIMLLVYRRRTRDAHRFRVVSGKGYRQTRVALGRWRVPVFLAVCLYLLIGIALPLLTLVWTSLSPYTRPISISNLGSMTLANYGTVFTAPGMGHSLLNTAWVVLLTATISTAISTWLAVAASRRQFPGSTVLFEATFLVFGIPSVVLGFAVLFLYVFIPVPPLYGTVWIIIVALVARYLPRGSRMVQTALLQLDDGLIEAAQVTGARPFTVTRTVLVPLLSPALRKCWLWIFAQALGELPIALVLTSSDNRTLVVELWNIFTSSGDYPTASALAVIILVVSTMAVWSVNRRGAMEES
ncbi:ABC transporter permease [Streptomyces tendae]|uniref:ABC transporter permease n=2 Tax=Streptomyces tendae TaxID=1932 RepID=UPI003651F0E8